MALWICAGALACLCGAVALWWRGKDKGAAVEAAPVKVEVKSERMDVVEARGAREAAAREVERVDLLGDDELDDELVKYEQRTGAAKL